LPGPFIGFVISCDLAVVLDIIVASLSEDFSSVGDLAVSKDSADSAGLTGTVFSDSSDSSDAVDAADAADSTDSADSAVSAGFVGFVGLVIGLVEHFPLPLHAETIILLNPKDSSSGS